MRIYYAIQYEDQREVESLISDSKTDVNWRNDVSYSVSVIQYINNHVL